MLSSIFQSQFERFNSRTKNIFSTPTNDRNFSIVTLCPDQDASVYPNEKHFFSSQRYGKLINVFPKVYASDVRLEDLGAKEWRQQKIREQLSRETKEDRLRRMYSTNEFGMLSPELTYIIRTGCSAFIFGGMLGALTGAAQSKETYLRRNKASQFETEYLATRHLTDNMSLSALQNGIKQGIKFGFCCTIYMLVAFTVANYNNKVTLYEHIAAGSIMGMVMRANFGLKGMAVAGGLGGVLGLLGGSAVLLTLKTSGYTFEEYRYYQHELFSPEMQDLSEAKAKAKTEKK